MTEYFASCRCGQLRAHCQGAPAQVLVCHCLNCQKRSGSAVTVQARWAEAHVTLAGTFQSWTGAGDSGGQATFRFCPQCGGTVAYTVAALPGMIAIPVGAFADPQFPAPEVSIYEERKHGWVAVLGDGVAHIE